MYITDKYWNNYIGDTDDSLTLLTYLADKQKEEISLEEIFSDIGLDKLNGDFHQSDEPLTVVLKNIESDYEEPYAEFEFAIDIITDLAALLLECKINESVDLSELLEDDLDTNVSKICITGTSKEHELINKALTDFISDPLTYDLSEMVDEEDLQEMAEICEELRKELYE